MGANVSKRERHGYQRLPVISTVSKRRESQGYRPYDLPAAATVLSKRHEGQGRYRRRSWEDLPATALVIIFKKLPLKDRLSGGPLVCKSWREASNSPQCWESMLPDYHGDGGACSYEYSFKYLFITQLRSNEFNSSPFGEFNVTLNVVQLFVERSKGNSNTICLPLANEKDAAFLLNFIIPRCPKLKNLSLRSTSEETFWPYQVVAGLVNSLDACKELEFLDLGIPFQVSVPNPHPLIVLSPKIRALRTLCMGEPGWQLQDVCGVFDMNWCNLEHLNLEWTTLRSSNEFESILDRIRNLSSLQFLEARPSCTSTSTDELVEKCKRIFEMYLHGPNRSCMHEGCNWTC